MPTTRFKKLQPALEPVQQFDGIVRGDLVPTEGLPWKTLLPKIHRVSQRFGFHRVETSPVEAADSFRRGLVPEQSSPFFDLSSNKRFGLRPQNFLSALRAYADHRVFEKERTTKWYYLEPVYSVEKNNLSSVHEYGLVSFGEPSPMSDAQVMTTVKVLLEEMGLTRVVFEINHKGCPECAPYYEEVLSRFLEQYKNDLCQSCQNILASSFSEKNPYMGRGLGRVFACSNLACQEILSASPQVLDHLDAACNKQITSLLEALDEIETTYQLNPRFFGDDRSSHTVFQVKVAVPPVESGEQTLAEGGRYNAFASKLMGQEMSVLLFSVPLLSIAKLFEQQGAAEKIERTADVFLINLGELAAKKTLRLFLDLMHNDISVSEQFGENGIKNQFKLAEKRGCAIALVIGQKEAFEGTVILRDVRSGIQEVFSYDRIIDEVRKRLND